MDQVKLNKYLKNIINKYVDYSPENLINMTFQNRTIYRMIFKYDFCVNIIDFMVKALQHGYPGIIIENLVEFEIKDLKFEYQVLIIDQYNMFNMITTKNSIEIKFKDDIISKFEKDIRHRYSIPIWYVRILLNETELIENNNVCPSRDYY